jgi:hypothetical protein
MSQFSGSFRDFATRAAALSYKPEGMREGIAGNANEARSLCSGGQT